MGKIIKISNETIIKSLENTTRQYFAGNLSKPQEIEFVRDERLEIGISSYPDYKYEPTHVHSVATEYQYMISGWTEYMDVETGEVSEFRKGDFYAILPGTAYAQRVKAGTSILFIKTPSRIISFRYINTCILINKLLNKYCSIGLAKPMI